MWNGFHKLRNGSAVKHVELINVQTTSPFLWEWTCSPVVTGYCHQEDAEKQVQCQYVEWCNSRTGWPDWQREKCSSLHGWLRCCHSLEKIQERFQKRQNIRLKRKFFVSVLKAMSAEHQPENVESVEDYSTLWSELINCGGLYHKSSDQVCCECDTCMYIYDLILVIPLFMQVYHFMLDVEEVVHTQLNIKNFSVPTSHSQDVNFSDSLIAQVIETKSVLSKWEDITHRIPHRFEEYSIELLKAVVRLWTTVRLHAFAKGWTMKAVSERHAKNFTNFSTGQCITHTAHEQLLYTTQYIITYNTA